MDRWSTAGGFSLVELLVVVGVLGVLAAIAAPSIGSSMRLYHLGTSTNAVATAIRGARYAAVTKNRTVRVRFNCPAANEFRVVEVLGNANDTAPGRCNAASYPFPDPNAAVAPNVDGPVIRLNSGIQFGAVQDIQIDPAGRVTVLSGAVPATVVVSNGRESRTISVTASGQIGGS